MWSMDETHELHFREVELKCLCNVNARNWKERIVMEMAY